jgi:hypothetical protein
MSQFIAHITTYLPALALAGCAAKAALTWWRLRIRHVVIDPSQLE